MLRLSKWNFFAILIVTIVSAILVIPSLLSSQQRDQLSGSLPSWIPMKVITLGLDLQGGSYLTLQIDKNDILKTQIAALREDVRRIFREEKINIVGGVGLGSRGVQFRVADAGQREVILSRLQTFSQSSISSALGQSLPNYLVTMGEDGQFSITITDAGINDRVGLALDRSIEVLRHRIDALGTKEASIQRQGNDRLVVEVPGVSDPASLKEVIGKTAKLEFRMVAELGADPNEYDELKDQETGAAIPVMKQVLLTGEYLVSARADVHNGKPIVDFQFNLRGGELFAQISTENVGKRFAIVLDNQVISAPTINEPITGGSGQISGNFTNASATRLAILLSSGALPAKLTIGEERTVGPGLGQDSIKAGKNASYLGTALVVIFMVVTYGIFGIFADIALGIHVILIFAIMILIGSTLTLPGVAGIVLTIGMAVDSNVLIYERIREEYREGRPILMALDAGFNRAFATIVDSNVTMLIAAVILFLLGSGPVKGFAVTLALGVLTTIFTAVTMTRFMIGLWYKYRRPSRLPI